MVERLDPQHIIPRATDIQQVLARQGNLQDARQYQRFFKTGPGEYGEGDRFRGIRVPVLRHLTRTYAALPLDQTERLLASPYHEDRMLALLIMVRQYQRGDRTTQNRLYRSYVNHLARINNWDLVDCSAPYLPGPHLATRDRAILDRWAASPHLWTRRIAIMATFHFIRLGQFDDTLRLAARLLGDPEDLMHKATGWMLREVGNRDRETLRTFLDHHLPTMPRTMLRYAIEKLPPNERRAYLTR